MSINQYWFVSITIDCFDYAYLAWAMINLSWPSLSKLIGKVAEASIHSARLNAKLNILFVKAASRDDYAMQL